MGEAVYYLAASYAEDDEMDEVMETVEQIADGLAFLNEVFQKVRSKEGVPPEDKLRLLSFLAGNPEEGSKTELCVAEKLRTKINPEDFLEKKNEIGEFPNLADLFSGVQVKGDPHLNSITHALPDITSQYRLVSSGSKLLLSDYVWHLTSWGPLASKISELTDPKRVVWVSDEHTTVGDLLLKLIDYEEVKI